MKTMTKTVPDAMPENVTNDATRTITDAMMQPGDCHDQGDLIFVRLRGLPKSAKPRAVRQLAEGSTQGSRHVCEIGDVFDCDAEEVGRELDGYAGETVGRRYVGPVIATVDGRALVTHPEHGDHDYRFDGCIAVVVQRNLTAEGREVAAQD